MTDWLDALAGIADQAVVLVTVADTKGSTPREAGAKMLVMRCASVGTIGGGHLEYKAIELARQLLAHGADSATTMRRFPLGPSLGQCCGGVAVLFFEPLFSPRPRWLESLSELRAGGRRIMLVSRMDAPSGADKLLVGASADHGCLGEASLTQSAAAIARDLLAAGAPGELRASGTTCGENVALLFEAIEPENFHIALFGAGHVATALVRTLSELACSITWIDSRAAQFPAHLPANVRMIVSDTPECEVAHASAGSYFLVMTHSHPLDQAICAAVLRRGDQAYLGLIGSRSKRRRFEKRLRAQGIPAHALASLTCPIGVSGITGKRPAEIAIAVGAQLLQHRERVTHAETQQSVPGA